LLSHPSPRLLLMDEPSMGLSPALVEQNANMALGIADRGYVQQTGEIVLQGSTASLPVSEDLRKAYLGTAR
jgi:branched-chain amino acid transport system ATP-binding protein